MAPSSLVEAVWTDGDPLAELVGRRDALRRLEDVAELYLARGQYDDAIGTVDAAAFMATTKHPGVLASERLEAVLEEISRTALPAPEAVRPAGAPRGGTDTKQRVLIVVTEMYPSGGHTRVLWRWIARDPGRVYSIATTQQHNPVPDGVREAVVASGGQVHELPPHTPPLQRAAALRALGSEADVIVLVDHPYDPLPTVAFAGLSARPPIVMFDHTDQMFWVGRGIVDVLMGIREVGAEFAAHRGMPDRRVIITPLPVAGPDGSGRSARQALSGVERSHARTHVLNALGWPSDTVLLVTVGSHHKWEGPSGHRLLDLVEPVLRSAPAARLVAAGARDEGRWAELRLSTGGRVFAAGVLPNGVGELLSAADIYLESRPIGGLGASTEAAAHGLPVLSGGATEFERRLLGTDADYGCTNIVGNAAYQRELARLIADPGLRHELGEKARRTLELADEAWEAAVEHAYALAGALGPIQPSELAPLPAPGEHDLLTAWQTDIGRGGAPPAFEPLIARRELIAHNPQLRPLYGSLEQGLFGLRAHYPAAFAAPRSDEAELRAVVAQLRLLSQLGVVEKYMIALAPSEAERAVPVLEAALAEGVDFELELTLDPDPARVRPAQALVLT